MPRKAKHVNAVFFHMNGPFAGSLRGIQYQQRPVSMCDRRHFPDMQYISRKIRGMGADQCPGIGPEKPFQCLIGNISLPIRGCEVHGHPLLFQKIQRPQHRIMVKIRGNHMISRLQEPEEHQIQRLSHIFGKDHPFRMRKAEERCQRHSELGDLPRHGQGALAHAPGNTAVMEGLQHGRRHSLRLLQRCGGMVKIDHQIRTHFPAFAMVSQISYIFVTMPTASFSLIP